MSIKKTTERELTLVEVRETLEAELERLRLLNRDGDRVARAEAYGTLQGAIEMACLWLEGRQPMMSRAEVASYLRGALARADTAAKQHKP